MRGVLNGSQAAAPDAGIRMLVDARGRPTPLARWSLAVAVVMTFAATFAGAVSGSSSSSARRGSGGSRASAPALVRASRDAAVAPMRLSAVPSLPSLRGAQHRPVRAAHRPGTRTAFTAAPAATPVQVSTGGAAPAASTPAASTGPSTPTSSGPSTPVSSTPSAPAVPVAPAPTPAPVAARPHPPHPPHPAHPPRPTPTRGPSFDSSG